MPKKKQIALVHFDHLQHPTIAVIGRVPFLVYVLLRRWATPSVTGHNSKTMHERRSRGQILAWLDHDTAGAMLGTSRQEVGRHLKRLAEFGWVRIVKIENNRRAYRLGYYHSRDGRPVIYADEVTAKLKRIYGKRKRSGMEWRAELPELEKELRRLGRALKNGRRSAVVKQ